MKQKILQIESPEWLVKVQSTRHITTNTLHNIGVPLRYVNLDSREDRENAFTNLLLVSNKKDKTFNRPAKEVLTDYVFSAMNCCLPGTSIVAITFQDLCDTLSPFNRYERDQKKITTLYEVDALFIYDFGIFQLKEWEQKAVGSCLMNRYNNMRHIACATENIPTNGQIAKHVGPVIWGVITEHCLCRNT